MAEKVRILTARPHRLLAPLIEELGRLNRQEKSVVLLVPEQLTLQTGFMNGCWKAAGGISGNR